MIATQTLILEPLSQDRIPDILKLDRLCLGGLWNEAGYAREVESPNSDLLILRRCENDPSHSSVEGNGVGEKTGDAESKACGQLNGTIIGMGCIWAILDEAHLTLLAVHPDYRRLGLGKVIIVALLRRARERGLGWVTLEVRVSNQGAIALYQHFGFEAIGQRHNYYQDNEEDAVIFWRKGIQDPSFENRLHQWDLQITHQLSQRGWRLDQRCAVPS